MAWQGKVVGGLLWLAVVGLASAAWPADIVTRKSGGRVAGKITGASKTELTIKPATGDAVAVPANDVAAVDWDEATADLKLGLADENGGRFESALQRITKSKNETSTTNEALKTEFDFLLARVQARQALADPAKRTAAIQQLQAFLKTASNHFRYYDALALIGQLQLANREFDAARSTYEQLAQAPWSDVKLAASIASGRILMGEGKLDEATSAFDAAIRAAGNSPADKARRYEAMLGKARALVQQSKHEEALQVLDEVIEQAPADDSTLQAEAYVLQGHALQALGRNKDAVLAYLHVDILFPREAGYHAESLYHMTRLWKLVQSPERSLDAEAKLQSTYPNSEWTKKLSGGNANE
uniref:Tetratricopeptide repeat protein n=1 Tax=Schlesneria paludicola TaxID=360056 RepID=A0A7C4QQU5_9PLAN